MRQRFWPEAILTVKYCQRPVPVPYACHMCQRRQSATAQRTAANGGSAALVCTVYKLSAACNCSQSDAAHTKRGDWQESCSCQMIVAYGLVWPTDSLLPIRGAAPATAAVTAATLARKALNRIALVALACALFTSACASVLLWCSKSTCSASSRAGRCSCCPGSSTLLSTLGFVDVSVHPRLVS
jgi:hypothetical protein